MTLLRPHQTTPWVLGLLALLPVVAAQPADTGLEQLRAQIVERLRDVVLVELEAIEREIETAATAEVDGYSARMEARFGRLESELDEAIDSLEEELYAVEKRVDAVLEVWDSEAERTLFEETFEPLENGFWGVAEDLNTELHALEERGAREHETHFGAGFRERLARRVDTLARTRLAYLERLANIAADRLNDARRLQEAGTLTADACTRLVDEAARQAALARPTGTALAAVRDEAENIRQEVFPAPPELDAGLAALERDLASLRARYRAEFARRRLELANLESYYR